MYQLFLLSEQTIRWMRLNSSSGFLQCDGCTTGRQSWVTYNTAERRTLLGIIQSVCVSGFCGLCVLLCVCVFTFYLCQTLFDYAGGTVCSPQTEVCVLSLSVGVPYISPSRLFSSGSHTHIIHTLQHTLRFDRVTEDTLLADSVCALSRSGCKIDPVLDLDIKMKYHISTFYSSYNPVSPLLQPVGEGGN